MRYHLLNNDIKLFLDNPVDIFDKKIKTRVRDWRTVRLNTSHNLDFLQLLLMESMSSHKQIKFFKWNEIFDKLEYLNFNFNPSHYFIKICLSVDYDLKIRESNEKNYLSYINELKKRGIIPNVNELKYFIDNQEFDINREISDEFKSLVPDISSYIVEHQVNESITTFIDEHFEMLNGTHSGIANLFVGLAGNLQGNSFSRSYKHKQSIKRDIILNYINNQSVTQERAFELIKLFRPKSSGCFEDFLQAESRTDMLKLINKMNGQPKIKASWYTPEQLSLIKIIEDKFGIVYLDNLK